MTFLFLKVSSETLLNILTGNQRS